MSHKLKLFVGVSQAARVEKSYLKGMLGAFLASGVVELEPGDFYQETAAHITNHCIERNISFSLMIGRDHIIRVYRESDK